MGAVFGALPGNSNSEIAEDQKRGQESRGDEPATEAIIAPPKGDDVATDQRQSQTSLVLRGNKTLDPSAHVVPIKQEVLAPQSVELDKKKQVEESENTPGVFTDKSVADNASLQPVADNAPLQPVADNAPLQPVADNASLQPVVDSAPLQPVADNAPIQVITASPVTKEGLIFSPNTLSVAKGSETAHTEVGGRTERNIQEPSYSAFPDTDPSFVQAEQLSSERSVKAEKIAERTDVGGALGSGILHRHHALEESHQVVSDLRGDTGDSHIDSHLRWEHGDLKNVPDQDQEEDLQGDRDQEQDFENLQDQDLQSDQDLDSEQHFSFIESDNDGERRSYEQCPARNMKVLGYGSVLCFVAIRIKSMACPE